MSASNSDHPPVFRGNLPNSPALSDARPTIAQTLSAEPDNYAQSEEALIKRAWDECNLLSLDGGGIRGYWSLLALSKLMDCIESCEIEGENDEGVLLHSFRPAEYPSNVSHVSRKDGEPEAYHIKDVSFEVPATFNQLRASRRYLPCHYFDYIGGSSTGGLIAIMLGALRMTVLDCLAEYESLGRKVFGKPRFFIQMRFGLSTRVKYDSKTLEDVFKDVAERRGEAKLQNVTFKYTNRHLCKTFVTSLAAEPGKPVAKLHIIRSYDYRPQQRSVHIRTPNTFRSETRGGSANLNNRGGPRTNTGIAQDFQIWQVARAATAAPLFFNPIILKFNENGASVTKEFRDGGFRETNNPTMEGIREIQDIEGNDRLGVVVSVGTARHPVQRQREWWIGNKLKGMFDGLTDPANVHEEVQGMLENFNFPYFRLNPEKDAHLLRMDLDAWSPKRRLWTRASGSSTLREIKQVFDKWYAEDHNVAKEFQRCAKVIVERRRLRAKDTKKWMRFADGTSFQCKQHCSDKGKVFSKYEDFQHHCVVEHGKRGSDLEREIQESKSTWEYRERRVSSWKKVKRQLSS